MPNAGQLVSTTIVSCDWLNENRHLDHLVILDASVKKDNSDASVYITNSRYFDIKGKFSDITDDFPNAFPSIDQFQSEARKLGINNNSMIVVYDDKGIYWSPRVWWLFKCFGFDHIAVLDGGLPEWERLNLSTVSDLSVNTWKTGDFRAYFQYDKIRFFHHILDVARDEHCTILDARSTERFQCIVPEPRAGLRSGTIPNSSNLPYTELLDGSCLKSRKELRTIFDAFELKDKALTFSCGTGITACILALAAEILNYKNLSVYDGSWTEFGTLTHE